VLAPVLGTVLVFGILGNLMQVGMLFSFEAMKPKLSHINPVEGLREFFPKELSSSFSNNPQGCDNQPSGFNWLRKRILSY
jgi:flagellar biosynthesis protein FlhB